MLDHEVLQIRDLRVYFSSTTQGTIKAVDGVSFAVREGETIGIVGESGAGKTVTSLALMQLLPPTASIVSGEILLDGDDLLSFSASEMRKVRGAKIAMVFQDPNTSLNPSFSIGFQVGESVRLHQGLRGRRLLEKVIDALKLVRIPAAEGRVKDYPHQMSGGMRQRVAGAIGLSSGPRLLIADEPTTSLDVTVQAQYLRLLREIQRETGLAMILITHDMGIVARLCHRVAIMYGGRIVETGTTLEIFDKPSHPYTISLLRSIPKLEGVDRLDSIDGEPPDPARFPPGCRFAPRCPWVKEQCIDSYPPEVDLGEGHLAQCWFAGEIG